MVPDGTEMSAHDVCVQELVGELLARTRHETRCDMCPSPSRAATAADDRRLVCPDIVLVDGELGTGTEFHEVEGYDGVTKQRRPVDPLRGCTASSASVCSRELSGGRS